MTFLTAPHSSTPQDVGVGVGTEGAGGAQGGDPGGDLLVVGGHDGGGGLARSDLVGEVGAGDDHNAGGVDAQGLGQDLAHA